jgi:protocatechuate 3,4-dioxygenase beta subunit
MEIRKRPKGGVAIALIIVAIAWCRHGDDVNDAPAAATSAARATSDLERLISHLPTPAQLKLHPMFITHGELRLEGQAIDPDKQPIGGATIELDGTLSTTSEADGSFVFEHLAGGDYVLTGEKATFYGEDTITLTADSEPDELELHSGVVVRVHVVDSDNHAVRDAKVEASRTAVVTDAEGNAVLRGVDLGSVRLEVNADNYGPVRVDVATGDDARATIDKTIVLAPGTPFGGTVVDEAGAPVASATVMIEQGHWRRRVDADAHGHWLVPFLGGGKVAVSANSDAHIAKSEQIIDHDAHRAQLDVVVHVLLGAVARGVVVDRAGAPIEKASVNVGNGYGTTDDKGHFEIKGITPGLVEVSATTERMAATMHKVQLDREVELRIEVVESSIAGIVRDTHGQPVEDATLIARGQNDVGSGYARSDELGKFDFGGLPPGVYDVVAERDKDKMGLPDHGVLVQSGARNVTIVLADLGTIAGRVVLDGKPVAYFGVSVSSDPEPMWLSTPDAVHADDGAFAIKDLHPGTYAVAIVGPSFERKIIHNVVVRDGATAQLGEISIDRGHVVRGTVRDERGMPIAGAFVTAGTRSSSLDAVAMSDQAAGTRGATSDAMGNYELAGLDEAADETWIQAVLGHAMAAPRQIKLEDTVVDLVIARTGSIDGQILHVRDTAQRVRVDAVTDGASFSVYAGLGGEFSIDRVPAGDYKLKLGYGTAMLPIHVHVDADATTRVSVDLPAEPVTLAVTGSECDSVSLQSPTGEYLAFEKCTHDAAEFVDVTPGTYRLCSTYDHCTPVTVTPTPIRQIQVLPDQPTPPPEEAPDRDVEAETPAP